MSTALAAPTNEPADRRTDKPTDANLLRDHIEGHELALHELLNRHEARLRWCLRNLGIPEYEIPDVWQEAALRMHRWAPGFKFECAVVTWLVTVMRRTGLNYLATQRRVAQPAATAVSEWEGHVTETVLLHRAEEDGHQELRFDIRQAVRSLPEVYRETVVLRYFYDYPVNVIAERLGVAPGTVKSRYARGRQLLQEALADSDYSHP